MSKIVRVNCQTGEVTVEDMTIIEETRRTADIATEAGLIAARAAARAQHQQDLATVVNGRGAAGYEAAIARLLGAST